MKILLIYPYCIEGRIHEEEISIMPMGIYFVGAVLMENGYDVEILNWYNINKTPGKIEEILRYKKPDIIGFSILHANRWGGIEIAAIAKKIDPGVKVIFGGIGATFLSKHLLTHFANIDFIVLKEGEYIFLNLVRLIEKNEYDNLKNIKGICFKQGGKIIKTESPLPVKDIDDLPVPAKYFTYQHVALTRGCPGNCTFCGSPQFWGQKVRFHSSEYFVNQLQLLYNKGVNFFYFSDDTFTCRKELVIDVCKKILKKKLHITWAAISRVNFINEEILCWMRKAGCVQISYGVESGSEKIRACLNKKIKEEDIIKAFELTGKYGILARAYFIYGSSGENQATIQETIDLIKTIKPLSIIFYILDIFPGTALYADFIKRTGLTDDIWLKQIEDIMYFQTDNNLSSESVMDFGKKLRACFYNNLPDFVESIELIDKKEFFGLHADFLSRLGMTFSHGDYAAIVSIPDKDGIAERLYRRALDYFPNHRSFLGLGMLKQQKGKFEQSIKILSKGVDYFPESEQMSICLAISYMNQGKYKKALSLLSVFKDSKDAASYIKICNEKV